MIKIDATKKAERDRKQKITRAEDAVTEMLDAEALRRGYRNDITGKGDIKSAALRSGYPGPYQAEGVAYASWMDACWSTCYATLAQVDAGTIPEPTIPELLTMLPKLVLP